MRKFRLLPLLSFSVIFLAVSCTKEGPEGPVGATGAQGPGGVAGPAGPAGPAGNVNYSAWYTTVAADWVTTGVAPYTATLLVNRTAPAITQAIIDNGLVLGYVSGWAIDGATLTRSTDIAQMPYLADLNSFDYYDFVVPGAGNIRYLYKSGNPWNAAALAGTKFRYVTVQGTIAGGRGVNSSISYEGHSADELKAMTYSQVMKLFNIPEEGTNIR